MATSRPEDIGSLPTRCRAVLLASPLRALAGRRLVAADAALRAGKPPELLSGSTHDDQNGHYATVPEPWGSTARPASCPASVIRR